MYLKTNIRKIKVKNDEEGDVIRENRRKKSKKFRVEFQCRFLCNLHMFNIFHKVAVATQEAAE